MTERVHPRNESFEDKLRKLSNSEIFEQLSIENRELAELGVRQSISVISHGASRYGHLYEDRGTRVTPMNFLMALLNSQRDLLKLSIDKFQELEGAVSRIAMATDILTERTGGFEWPEQFMISPLEQLPPKKS